MLDVLSLPVPAELSLILSFLLRGGGFRRCLFSARHFPLKTRGNAAGFLLLCLRLLFASRKCKTFFRSSFFAPLQNYRSFSHFCSAVGGFRRRCFTQGTFRSKPTAFAVGFLLLCLRLLFASRKCKTFIRSSFLRNYRSFSHFCSAEAASAAVYFTQGTFRSKPTAFAVGFLLLCLRLLFASRKCKTFIRSSFLRNYRSFSHFCSAEAASTAAVSRKALFAQNLSPFFL